MTSDTYRFLTGSNFKRAEVRILHHLLRMELLHVEQTPSSITSVLELFVTKEN